MTGPTSHSTFHLGLLVLPGFPMACLTNAIEPLRAANEIAGREVFRWSVLTESAQPVQASAGIRFQPDTALSADLALDLLLVLSSPQGEIQDLGGVHGALRALARHGTPTGAISGGVFPLARTGLLDGFAASVHWVYKAAFTAEFPAIDARDDLIIVDRTRYTASGATAAFDMMLMLIEQTTDAATMTEVACWFQHPLVRTTGVMQKTPGIHLDTTADALPPRVAKAIALFSENLATAISVSDIAGQIGMSPRQLERAFKDATGQSPALYYRHLRLRAARQQVVYTGDSIQEIAHAVGYGSAATLSRYYRDAFGLTPQEERRNINTFRVETNRPLPSV
ncbi:GlxA family transcriptional regulator [Shimia abyssi]|uniref:Transcriptional regulator GlxA family with amidase domain n=1 Tax=Shimia abyssi TaxID=1662395 RepID=A0A2P8F8L4_9RHOB|nr:GlxA family transcriptional regulator [Shimia abyssi]PSL18045.1 transcriptional regulator GlxA family with amidase domain [Shimia abyssi]